MGRPSNTTERRAQIVQALLSVMSQNGYERASIQAIAKEAKLTSGLIHYHFKTKQDILVALVNWMAEVGISRLNEMENEATTPWEKLTNFINARLATGEGESPTAVFAWVMIASESIRQPEIKIMYEALIEAQLQTFQQLIAEAWGKKPKDKEVKMLSAIVLSAMEGAFQLSATAGGVMPKGYAAEGIIGLIDGKIN